LGSQLRVGESGAAAPVHLVARAAASGAVLVLELGQARPRLGQRQGRLQAAALVQLLAAEALVVASVALAPHPRVVVVESVVEAAA
jgi:hypothetical protein